MKKSVYFLFFIILCNYNLVNAADKINLISLNDIKIIFLTDSKTWNQNLVFLDKKLILSYGSLIVKLVKLNMVKNIIKKLI